MENTTDTKLPASPPLPAPAGSARRCCPDCGGTHEPTGARLDCIRHWKRRAVEAENACLVAKIYGMPAELRAWLDGQQITSENIGGIRRRLLMPFDSGWNGLVRDETAARENMPNAADEP